LQELRPSRKAMQWAHAHNTLAFKRAQAVRKQQLLDAAESRAELAAAAALAACAPSVEHELMTPPSSRARAAPPFGSPLLLPLSIEMPPVAAGAVTVAVAGAPASRATYMTLSAEEAAAMLAECAGARAPHPQPQRAAVHAQAQAPEAQTRCSTRATAHAPAPALNAHAAEAQARCSTRTGRKAAGA